MISSITANINGLIKKLSFSNFITYFVVFISATLYVYYRYIAHKYLEISVMGGRDWFVYLDYSQLSIFDSEIFFGFKPFTIPFFYSFVTDVHDSLNHNFLSIHNLQDTVSVMAWLFLGITLISIINNNFTRVIVFVTSLSFSLIHVNAQRVITSEPLTYSLFVLTFAGGLLFAKYINWKSAIPLLMTIILFTSCRFANAYLTGFVGMILVCLAMIHSFKSPQKGVSQMLAIIGVIFCLISFAAIKMPEQPLKYPEKMVYKNYSFPHTIPNVSMVYFSEIMFKIILPHEERVQFFENYGMPTDEEVMKFKNADCCGDGWKWFRSEELKDHYQWTLENGKRTYLLFLIQHPDYTFGKSIDDYKTILSLERSITPRIVRPYRKDPVPKILTFHDFRWVGYLGGSNGWHVVYPVFFLVLMASLFSQQSIGKTTFRFGIVILVLNMALFPHILLISHASPHLSAHRHIPTFHYNLSYFMLLTFTFYLIVKLLVRNRVSTSENRRR